MSGIVLATASAELEQLVQGASDGPCLSLPPGPLPTEPAQLFAPLAGAALPDVVVIDAGLAGTERALHLASRLDEQCPGVAVVLVCDQPGQIGLAAMRAGVRDILSPDANRNEVRMILDRARPSAPNPSPDLDLGLPAGPRPPRGRVLSVVSPKGGVGKTTVATNLAVGLAKAERHSTVLVDLDIQFGDVASALNLEPEYTLPDAVHGPASRDPMVLKTFLTQHETGLYVVCGPETPAAADSVSAEDVSRLLEVLASEFRYVVVDTAPGLSEHTLAVMDQTSDLILVTSMDVPGVRGLRKELDTLDALSMFTDARRVVLNFADRGGLSRADVEATIGTSVDLLLPRSKAAAASVNQGIPLLQSGVRDPMTKRLHELVDRYTLATARSTERRPGRRAARHRGTRGSRR